MRFQFHSKLKPTGDQPQAIKKLTQGINKDSRDQTLLGVTGSGKTLSMAKVIENAQKPTLVISHNKTLAAQLYSEFKEFFPKNAVHYFVSYYDYYQPEAYIPQTDTYIGKETNINEEIDRLRNAATASLISRTDVIIVASVSCIYGLGDPEEYENIKVEIKTGQTQNRNLLLKKLVQLQYNRNDIDFSRGTFRVRGDTIEIIPSYTQEVISIEFFGNRIEKIKRCDLLTGEVLEELKEIFIFPAKHFVTPQEKLLLAIESIKDELKERIKWLKKHNKLLEAQRLHERTNFDIEMMRQTGYCHGIENYSRHLSNRLPGQPPFTLLDYFIFPRKSALSSASNHRSAQGDYLIFIDESHMTIPQINGMYQGDKARKEILIEYGFRLPSALDNRPLKFDEFDQRINQVIYVSATPRQYEFKKSRQIVEQLIRPTGLLDPTIEIKPTKNQIDDLVSQIQVRCKKHERILVTTLTKRMAEDLAEYLKEMGIKVHYLHSEINTFERVEILRDLRLGKYDVVVGINLLREGLDLPEVSLVAILDADKEGYLRSDIALIQTMGRASRHINGHIIMYADKITGSIERAIKETERRRKVQEKHNKEHHIAPHSIKKEIRKGLIQKKKEEQAINLTKIPKDEINHLIKDLESQMDLAARNLEFEKAAKIRDQISEIRKNKKLLST